MDLVTAKDNMDFEDEIHALSGEVRKRQAEPSRIRARTKAEHRTGSDIAFNADRQQETRQFP